MAGSAAPARRETNPVEDFWKPEKLNKNTQKLMYLSRSRITLPQ
jgi:hypothetical protein